jgi:hypothetical protein
MSLTQARYDALTTDNKVVYQNALNSKNISFAKACGGVLINYCWKEADAINSYGFAEEYDLLPRQVFFGVDVWAQNKSSFTHPRVTYPEYGGGGTNTGIAVDKLAELGLSVGIFAPAWSFEHFPGRGRVVEPAIWDGRPLPENITCSCGSTHTYHPSDRGCSVTRSAQQYSVGSENFFYTDFCRGFGRHSEKETNRIYSGKAMHSQLASQSVLPHMPRAGALQGSANTLCQRLEDVVGKTFLVIESHSVLPVGNVESHMYDQWLPVFKMGMPMALSLELSILYRSFPLPPLATTSLYLKCTTQTRLFMLEASNDLQLRKIPISLEDEVGENVWLDEIGVHVRALQFKEQRTRILEIHEIRVVPREADRVSCQFSLDGLRLEKRGEGETEHRRLCWSYHARGDVELGTFGMPCSDITGPFSYFAVTVDGLDVGRAYALECLIPELLIKELKGTEVVVAVEGIGFDGRKLGHAKVRLHID